MISIIIIIMEIGRLSAWLHRLTEKWWKRFQQLHSAYCGTCIALCVLLFVSIVLASSEWTIYYNRMGLMRIHEELLNRIQIGLGLGYN